MFSFQDYNACGGASAFVCFLPRVLQVLRVMLQAKIKVLGLFGFVCGSFQSGFSFSQVLRFGFVFL